MVGRAIVDSKIPTIVLLLMVVVVDCLLQKMHELRCLV